MLHVSVAAAMGFLEAIDQCKAILNIEPEADDTELSRLLRSHGLDVSATVDAWLLRHSNEPTKAAAAAASASSSTTTHAQAAPFFHTNSSKRARVEEPIPEQQQQQQAPGVSVEILDALRLDPFTRTALAGPQPTSTILMAELIHAQFEKLKIDMPGTVAGKVVETVPRAMREYDELQAEIAANARAEEASRPLLRKIEACTAVYQLVKLPGWSLNKTENLLICDDCYRHATHAPGHLRRGRGKEAGVISGISPHRKFFTVKQMVHRHVQLGLHDWCVCKASEVARIEEKGRSAGMICGKMVLAGVKCHDSDRSFEERITTLASIGVGVGTRNHSRFFVPQLRDSMHIVTIKAIKKGFTTPMAATKRPPPFCGLADKATLQRQTGQMHGAVLMIVGELIAVMLSVLPCPDSSGAGCGGLLVDVFTGGKPLSLPPSLVRRSQTGFAFDGQYQSAHEGHASGLDVRSHYCGKLHLKDDYIDSRWDGAHRIELGMNTVEHLNVNFES